MAEIMIVPTNGFVFAIPELPNNVYIEAVVNYTRDDEGHVNSEAWLHSTDYKAIMYLADICSFGNVGQPDSEIEDRLLDYYNTSEVFAESVSALVERDYEYFRIEDSRDESERDKDDISIG